jgi:hypothetical protein
MSELEQPINKVTTTNLDIALRMCNIEINKKILDKIIDIIELIEEKGDEVKIKDICQLQSGWDNMAKLQNELDS